MFVFSLAIEGTSGGFENVGGGGYPLGYAPPFFIWVEVKSDLGLGTCQAELPRVFTKPGRGGVSDHGLDPHGNLFLREPMHGWFVGNADDLGDSFGADELDSPGTVLAHVLEEAKRIPRRHMVNCALQNSQYGITANNLAPGVIATDRNAKALSDHEYSEQLRANIPVGRIGTPADCAGLALLLCSDAGAYITGEDIAVDGGMHL